VEWFGYGAAGVWSGLGAAGVGWGALPRGLGSMCEGSVLCVSLGQSTLGEALYSGAQALFLIL
jgi:hypothetical protein